MSRLFRAIILAGAIFQVTGCTAPPSPWPEGRSPRVLVTLPAYYSFVTNVAGDHAAVVCLLSGTGPHDYQPTAQDSLKLRSADLFFANGLELDGFAAKLKSNSGNSALPLIELGEVVPHKIAAVEEHDKKEGQDMHGHGHDHGHAHHHGETDPHVWLGIDEALSMIDAIADALAKKDPTHARDYAERARAYKARLQQIKGDGQKLLDDVKPADRKLIAFHDSLNYFARNFGLKIAGVIELQAGMAPDAAMYRKLIETCKKEKVRVIAVEPQYPSSAAEQLRKDAEAEGVRGLTIVTIDPLETAAPRDLTPEFYEKKMTENITNLAKALKGG